MEPTRTFDDETYRRALESWGFVDLAGKAPLFTSPFGDVFLEDVEGIWMLDLLEGTLARVWSGREEMLAALQTAEGQDQYLLLGLALGAEARGLVPGPREVYGFTQPPVLGGPVEVENVEVTDVVVSLNITGQIHAQVRDLPPGTRISGFTVDGGQA